MAYKTLVRPYSKSQVYQMEKVQKTAARWTCKRWRNTSHVSDMLNELDWPALEDRREQASLAFFHKRTQAMLLLRGINILPLYLDWDKPGRLMSYNT